MDAKSFFGGRVSVKTLLVTDQPATRPELCARISSPRGELAVLTLAARLDIQTPGISVVLITEASQQMWQAAMRSGIRDLLSPSAAVSSICPVLRRRSSD